MAKLRIKQALHVTRLREEAPNQASVLAADRWDSKHRVFSATSELNHLESGTLTSISRGHSDPSSERSFRQSLNDVRRNRFVALDTGPEEVKVYEKVRRAVEIAPFDLYKSIWSPRVNWAESADLYDTAEIRMRRFEVDWNRAMAMGLVKVIMQNDDGDDDGVEDEDGDGIPDEVEEVGEMLWQHNGLLYALFNHYAALSHSLDSLSLNSWTTFVQDCHLANNKSRFCKVAHMDQVYLRADSMGKRYEATLEAKAKDDAREQERQKGFVERSKRAVKDQEHMLSRGEFNIALVCIGINKYVLTGEVKDVSDAMHRLLGVDVQSRLGALVTTDPDIFRCCFCYPEPTCLILKTHEAVLHVIFEYIAAFGAKSLGRADKADPSDAKRKTPTITLKEWLSALKHLEIMDRDLSERDALRCFSWSRMAVEDYQSHKGHHKNTVLPFEGFLEALCRVAAQKALATDEEVFMAGLEADLPEYMHQLKMGDVESYNQLLDARKIPWCGAPPDDFPRAVECVIRMFEHAIKRVPPPCIDDHK